MTEFNPMQSNFELIAKSYEDLATELRHCINLPVVQEGSAIVRELRAVREGIENLRQEVRQELGELRHEVGRIRALVNIT